MRTFPYVITISSEKGGVGKTTLATNLAIYLKAMRDDLPITIFSFDNHFTIDHMFEMKGQRVKGTVHELLMGVNANELLHMGQYGVNYIPSSNELSDISGRFSGPMALTRLFAESNLPGIVIVDTRPDLNILTQNALYAADRVLIPVKDMPSLENCKNIFALFDQRGIDKKSLMLLPCLVDSRIKFDGIFKDQKTLLRAFAINRGYRCLDTFISKSPKVESLNTNPDGKIYPILTHARGTEVYGQFTTIARDILTAYDATPEPRSSLYASWLQERESKKKIAFMARLEGLAQHCLLCGKSLEEHGEQRGFYYESSERASRGFLHTDCYTDLLCAALYGMTSDSQAIGAARLVISDKAAKTISFFVPHVEGDKEILDFRQFSPQVEQIFQKSVPIRGNVAEGEFEESRLLYQFLHATLAGDGRTLRQGSWLAVHPVNPENPESVLQEDYYRAIQKIHAQFVSLMPQPELPR